MSIAQFLSYITLFEGGIGGVARALLYEPLARQKTEDIARIVYSISRFFKWIAFGFLAYTFVLACIYKQIAHFESFSFWNSFLLVLVISISTMGQYYIGMAYQVLFTSFTVILCGELFGHCDFSGQYGTDSYSGPYELLINRSEAVQFYRFCDQTAGSERLCQKEVSTPAGK